VQLPSGPQYEYGTDTAYTTGSLRVLEIPALRTKGETPYPRVSVGNMVMAGRVQAPTLLLNPTASASHIILHTSCRISVGRAFITARSLSVIAGSC